jgi:hypothetical protein
MNCSISQEMKAIVTRIHDIHLVIDQYRLYIKLLIDVVLNELESEHHRHDYDRDIFLETREGSR